FIIRIDTSEGALHALTRKVVEAKLEEEIQGIGGANIALKMLDDHVHIIAQITPNAAVDDIVHLLMESSSELVSGMGRNEKLIWQPEFGAVSVSKSHLEILTKYVETQEERHAGGNINETLERTTSAE
ncbi:MAG TPA: hypothetical protein ENN75_01100, partial [candidate division Zixibacteria bacterium]|nr:hypothetical protein [candidate division Zixibacteria bacterium]